MSQRQPRAGSTPASRLCLVTPAEAEPDFAAALEQALAGGDVACLFIGPLLDPATIAALVPVARAHGVAAIVAGDATAALRVGADGVHVEAGLPALKAAIAAVRPKLMVGAGAISGRDHAMRIGEAEPDYLFFGRLDGDTGPDIFPKALRLAEWWAELFELPAVVMGGTEPASVTAAARAGIEFVCLRQAVWTHPDGPEAAVRLANRHLAAAAIGAEA